MEISLPEYPSDTVGRAIFICTIVLMLLSLVPVTLPQIFKRVWALVEKNERAGSIGELRVAGTFVIGLCLSSLLFAQPVIVLALAAALGFASFGRILSMMSDQAVTFANFLVLVLQILVATVMFTTFFDVWEPDSTVAFPETLEQKIVFAVYVILMLVGLWILFAPRISMSTLGLTIAENSQGGEAVFRSAGGFLFGVGLTGMLVVNPMLDLAIGVALFFSCLGRIAAIIFDRGNLRMNIASLSLQFVLSGLILSTVFGYL